MANPEVDKLPLSKITSEMDKNDADIRRLLETTASAMFIYKGGRLKYVNHAMETLTGYLRRELLDKDLCELFDPDSRSTIQNWGKQAEKNKSFSSRGEFAMVTKSGEERWVNIAITGTHAAQRHEAYGTAFDITEHKRTEKLQDAVYRIAQAADSSKDLDDLFRALHEIISEVMNARNFYIALLDHEKDILSFPYYVDEFDSPPGPSRPGKGCTEYVLRTGKSLLVDLEKNDELTALGEIELVGAPSPIWLGVPLIVDNTVIGVMVVQHYSDPDAYGEQERRILEFVSSQVAMAINRKRSEDALRESELRYHRRADELAGLYETARDLATQKDLKTLLTIVVDRVTSLLNSTGCSIYLFDTDHRDLEVVVSHGMQGMVGTRLRIGEGFAGKVAQQKKSLVIDDYPKFEQQSRSIINLSITSIAGVPMVYGGDLVGVLTVYEYGQTAGSLARKFSKSEVNLLAVFAGSAAVAVHNNRLFDETRQRLLELEILYQTSLAATQIFSVHAVAQQIIDTLFSQMNWKNGAIWLKDPYQQKLILLARTPGSAKTGLDNHPDLDQAVSVNLNDGILGLVCTTGQTVRIGDNQESGGIEDGISGSRSELCVPLKLAGKIIGCIMVGSDDTEAFSGHDERLLSTLAAQAAAAIDNATLYQDALSAAERRSILHQASQEIAHSSQEPDQVYVAVHRAATRLMAADVFVITLFDESKKEIHGVYLIDSGERHPNNVLQAGQGISGRVISSGKPILIQDFNKTKKGINPFVFGKRGMTRSILAVPMRSGERIIGMISVQSYEPNRYTGDDSVLLEMLAAHAGAAIENARLFEETRKRMIELDLLYQSSSSDIQLQGLNAVAQRIMDAIENLLHWNGSIWIVENQLPILLAYSGGKSGIEPKNVEAYNTSSLIPAIEGSSVGMVLKNGGVIRTGDIRIGSHYTYLNENTISILCVPLKSGKRIIGCINVESVTPNAFSEQDEHLLMTLANQAAVVIENARLFEETRRRTVRQAALNSIITLAARADVDFDELLTATLEQTLKALNLDMGAIWLSWSSRGVQWMACKNLPQTLIATITNTNLTRVIPLTRTLSVDDWVNEKHRFADQFLSLGIHSTIIVPLSSKEKQIGGITIASPETRHWTVEELSLVEAISREVGSAAERAKLFEETTSRLDELEVVNKVSTSLRLAQSLNKMLPQLIDETLKALDVESGAIWLYDPERNKLVQAISRGWCSQVAGLELGNGESLAGNAFSTGDIYFSHDVAEDRFTSERMRELCPPGWSAICLPIHSEQKPIGVLMASTQLPREFSPENARLLVTLTEMAGNAIHRTRLNEKLVSHAAALEVRVKERTSELQSALQKAQEADRLKSEFIANVNHELRTPLTNLVLYYQMLRAQPNTKTEERLDVIGRELQRLRSLIEDLLNLSRLDLGQVTLHPVPSDLNALVRTLVNDRRSLAEERGLDLMVDLKPDLGMIWLDEATIVQVVSNLLTNALNYTPRGGKVTVTTLVDEDDDGTWAGFRVRDNGRGIDNEDMPHLFDRFYRGKAGHQSGAPGTGLGLAIVKQVVEHHKGRIDVENAIGESGAVFTVWLPINVVPETI
jgi:PAS domain S-box-containing protein